MTENNLNIVKGGRYERLIKKIYVLAQDGEVKYTGFENSCYFRLQAMQSQSANWAMKYGGWTVEPFMGSAEQALRHAKADLYYNLDGTSKR